MWCLAVEYITLLPAGGWGGGVGAERNSNDEAVKLLSDSFHRMNMVTLLREKVCLGEGEERGQNRSFHKVSF